jgi:calcineurin-like phosphoesterase family protein
MSPRLSSGVGVLVALLATGCADADLPRPFADHVGALSDPPRLIVVGDLQRTSYLEFWREQNDPERKRIVGAIEASGPDLLAITGDCVFDGGSDGQWGAFDALVADLHEKHVPAIAAFGNHEYWQAKRTAAEAHFFPRFPMDHGRHWFDVAFGPLRLVVLDANEDQLSGDEQRAQRDWYEVDLRRFDLDPTVRGVLVLFHEPPYSNSTVTGDDLEVQRDFVPAFLAATKTLAMLNGHVHSYERFLRGGKMFVVSGGGGGPRHDLETGASRRHRDDLFCGPPRRDFHFTIYDLTSTSIEATVMGLPKGGTELYVMDRFALPWPPDPPAGLRSVKK